MVRSDGLVSFASVASVASVAGAVVAAFAAPAAQGAIDQVNWNPGGIGAAYAISSNVEYAQTFRTGTFGFLEAIELPVWRSSEAVTNDLIVRVRRVNGPGLAPSDEVLFSQVISCAQLGVATGLPNPQPVLRIEVLSALIFADVAQYFAVSLQRGGPASPPWVEWGSGGESYAAGGAWWSSGLNPSWDVFPTFGTADFAFRTFMIPGPGAAASVGALGVLGCSRRRRRGARAC